MRRVWFDEMERTTATQTLLNATQNYPLLSGQKVNLYKCFLPQSWWAIGRRGVVGLLHPEGVYDDPNAGIFRAALYPKLRGHFQFINERNLFSEVHHHTKFSVNVYRHGRAGRNGREEAVSFAHISNLFVPPPSMLVWGTTGMVRYLGSRTVVASGTWSAMPDVSCGFPERT